jgi:hypothetical protein
MMMPLGGLVKHQSGMVIWKATPHAIVASTSSVSTYAKSTRTTFYGSQAIFVHKQLDMGVMGQHLQTVSNSCNGIVAILVALGEDSETLPSDRRPIVLIRKGARTHRALDARGCPTRVATSLAPCPPTLSSCSAP